MYKQPNYQQHRREDLGLSLRADTSTQDGVSHTSGINSGSGIVTPPVTVANSEASPIATEKTQATPTQPSTALTTSPRSYSSVSSTIAQSKDQRKGLEHEYEGTFSLTMAKSAPVQSHRKGNHSCDVIDPDMEMEMRLAQTMHPRSGVRFERDESNDEYATDAQAYSEVLAALKSTSLSDSAVSKSKQKKASGSQGTQIQQHQNGDQGRSERNKSIVSTDASVHVRGDSDVYESTPQRHTRKSVSSVIPSSSMAMSMPSFETANGVLINEAYAPRPPPLLKKELEPLHHSHPNLRNTIPSPSTPVDLPSTNSISDERSPSSLGKLKNTPKRHIDTRKTPSPASLRLNETKIPPNLARMLKSTDQDFNRDDFPLDKTVSMLLTMNDKHQGPKQFVRGKSTFESMLADAHKKREKLIMDGSDYYTAHATTIQLELKAYDHAFQDVHKHIKEQDSDLAHMLDRIYSFLRGLVISLPDIIKECTWKLQELEGNEHELKSKITLLNDEKLRLEQINRQSKQDILSLNQKIEYLQKELEQQMSKYKDLERIKDKCIENSKDDQSNIKILEQQIRDLMVANRNSNLFAVNMTKDLEQSLIRCHKLERELAQYRPPGDKTPILKDEPEVKKPTNPLEPQANVPPEKPTEHPSGSTSDNNTATGPVDGAVVNPINIENIHHQSSTLSPAEKSPETLADGNAKSSLESPTEKAEQPKARKTIGKKIRPSATMFTDIRDDYRTLPMEEVQYRINRLQPLGHIDLYGDVTQKLLIITERLATLEIQAGKKPYQTLTDPINRAGIIISTKRYIPFYDDIDRDTTLHKRPVRGIEWLSIMIEQIYDEKYRQDSLDFELNLPVDPLPEFLITWALDKKETKKMARQFIWDLFVSSRKFRKESPMVSYFADFLEERYTVEDLTYYVRCRRVLRDGGRITTVKPMESEPSIHEHPTLELVKIGAVHCKNSLHLILRNRSEDTIEGIVYKAQASLAHPHGDKDAANRGVHTNPQVLHSSKQMSTFQSSTPIPTIEMYSLLSFIMEEYFSEKNKLSDKIYTFFHNMDTDEDGLLTRTEFMTIINQVFPELHEREIRKMFSSSLSLYAKDGIGLDSCLNIPPKYLPYLRRNFFHVPVTEDVRATDDRLDVIQTLSTRWQQLSPLWGLISSLFPEGDRSLQVRIEDAMGRMNMSMKSSHFQTTVQIYRSLAMDMQKYLNINGYSFPIEWAYVDEEMDSVLNLIRSRYHMLSNPEKNSEFESNRSPSPDAKEA